MGNCSDPESTRREVEISLINGSIEKTTWIQTGKPGDGDGDGDGDGRRESKLSESTQKRKLPQRGVGVEQLERQRFQERMIKKMTEINPLHPLSFQNHHFTTLQTTPFGAYSITNTGVGLGQEGFDVQQPALLLQGFGNGSGYHGPVVSSGVGPLFSDETFLADPFAVGSGFRTTGNGIEASKALSSVPNNVRWNPEHCGVCYKKIRGNGENIICNGERKMCGEMSPVNGFGNFAVGNKGNMFPTTGTDPVVLVAVAQKDEEEQEYQDAMNDRKDE